MILLRFPNAKLNKRKTQIIFSNKRIDVSDKKFSIYIEIMGQKISEHLKVKKSYLKKNYFTTLLLKRFYY
jgi:hypothetical protein